VVKLESKGVRCYLVIKSRGTVVTVQAKIWKPGVGVVHSYKDVKRWGIDIRVCVHAEMAGGRIQIWGGNTMWEARSEYITVGRVLLIDHHLEAMTTLGVFNSPAHH